MLSLYIVMLRLETLYIKITLIILSNIFDYFLVDILKNWRRLHFYYNNIFIFIIKLETFIHSYADNKLNIIHNFHNILRNVVKLKIDHMIQRSKIVCIISCYYFILRFVLIFVSQIILIIYYNDWINIFRDLFLDIYITSLASSIQADVNLWYSQLY